MKITYGALLPLPPDEAFAFVADPRNWPLFVPGVRAVDEDDDWGRAGGHARLVSVVLGRSLTMKLELTEWDPPKAFRYTVSQGERPGNDDNRRTFRPVPGGTRLTGTTEIPTRRGAAGLLDRLQMVLVRAVFARAMSRLPAAAGTLAPVTGSRRDSHHEHRATTTAVMVIGLLVAMAAAEHGIGEAAERPDVSDGPLIKSWPDAAVFDQLNGEPAMTFLPDPVLAGLVTIALSALFAWVAVRNDTMHHAGVVLLFLSGALLLAGGGLAPPLIGSLLGLTWLAARRDGVRRPGAFRRRLARLWRVALVVTAASYLALFPGTVLLHWWFGVNSAALVAVLGLAAFTGLFVTLPAAVTADRPREEPQP